MFAAHLFAGYLCSRQYLHKIKNKLINSTHLKYYIAFGIFCSVLPDFDLLYFYTIDNQQHLHHTYWTHIPIFWVVAVGLFYSVSRWFFKKHFGVLSLILLMNTWLHLILDTVAGGIYWLYPLSDINVQLMHITARYNWWVLNYIFHWTFFLEICIMLTSVIIYRRDRKILRMLTH